MTAGFFAETTQAASMRDELIAMIKARDEATPRSQQRELGPSEIGHPCVRRLAYGLLDVQRCNPSWDPLPAIIGTATHKWLESAAKHANNTLGRQRWLVETRVSPASWLSGSCDLYDSDTATVIDYKVPGANQFAKAKKGPSELYRTQVHLYGKGFVNSGLPVSTVAIMFLPRGGTLAGAHYWSEPYSPDIADAAIRRREQTLLLLNDFDVDRHPDRFGWLSKSGPGCVFCPWFSVNPSGPYQCEGVAE